MIRCRNNRAEHHRRVSYGHENVEALPECAFANLSLDQAAPENAGMKQHGAPNAESITEVHAGHRSQRIDNLAFHPNALSVVVSNSIQKAVTLGQQPRRHGRVECESDESKKIRQGECSASDREDRMIGRNIIIPGDETDRPRDVYQRIRSIQKRQSCLMSIHEPLLYVMLSDRKHPRERRVLLEPQYPCGILLSDFPDLVLVENRLANNFGHPIEEISDYPIEHFDQEGELL